MPHHLDRHFSIAVLDCGHVAQKIVALRFVVVQPANYIVHGRWVDEDDSLAPDDFDASDSCAEFILQRLGRWIGFGAAMRHAFLGDWLASGRTRPRSHDLES